MEIEEASVGFHRNGCVRINCYIIHFSAYDSHRTPARWYTADCWTACSNFDRLSVDKGHAGQGIWQKIGKFIYLSHEFVQERISVNANRVIYIPGDVRKADFFEAPQLGSITATVYSHSYEKMTSCNGRLWQVYTVTEIINLGNVTVMTAHSTERLLLQLKMLYLL